MNLQDVKAVYRSQKHSAPVRRMKGPKVTRIGQPCRKCGTPVIEQKHSGPSKTGQSYWFKRWLKCPACKTLYMLESEKVWL